MPTVLTIFGLRVVIYPNDHQPAHVHIIGNGCEAVFILRCESENFGGDVALRENFGFSRKDITKIAEALTINLALLCKEWRRFHGYH